MGDGINPFSGLERFAERVQRTDFGKLEKTATGFFRGWKAKSAYDRALRDYDAETAEASLRQFRLGAIPAPSSSAPIARRSSALSESV